MVGCDGANSTVRDLIGVAGHRPRLLLRLADRRRRAARATGVRPDQRPDLRARAGPPPWCRAARAGGGGSSCACPTRPSPSSTTRTGRGSCSRPGTSRPADATLERHAVYRFQARWADRWRRGQRAARRRRRPPDAAVRRPGHVLGPARRRQPGVEARPRARRPVAARRCSTPTRSSAATTCGPSSTSRWRSARSSASPTRPRPPSAMR